MDTQPEQTDRARYQLAAIVESSDDAIIGKDLKGVVTSWNRGAEAIFGYTSKEMTGNPIALLIPRERLAEEELILARIRNGEKLAHFETERVCRDGRVIPVSLTISPIRDGDGEIIGISKIARDLSEVQQARRDLGRREALLGAILETAPDALVVIDNQGIIQSFSIAAIRLFGFNAEEVIGRNIKMLMPASYRYQHDSHLARYRTTGEPHIIGVGRTVFGQRKNGSVFPMELQVGEVSLPGTQLFAGFIRDLTERQAQERRVKELQAELFHSARVSELGQMVTTLAHEVNQPLTAMSAYLNGIRRLLVNDGPPAAQQALEKVLEQCFRMQQIIQRIRDQVNKRETEKRVENLLTTIEEAASLALLGVDQGLRLEIAIGEDATEAYIDRIQIQQVLTNLIRNASEATQGQAQPEVLITTARLGKMVEIRVADNGPGLPETVRAKLFQPFLTTKATGMGVGLSVCRSIVELHGGEIRAEARDSGGTVFRFTIPRHTGPA